MGSSLDFVFALVICRTIRTAEIKLVNDESEVYSITARLSESQGGEVLKSRTWVEVFADNKSFWKGGSVSLG